MIPITPQFGIEENELYFDFFRASGPGGQNVNKVSTAVRLRFDVRHTPSLPADLLDRLVQRAGNRLTEDGILIISAQRFRTQELNRKDAVNRLVRLLQQAAIRPKKRRKTSPTLASAKNRIMGKLRRRSIKRLRRTRHSVEE